MSISRTHLLDKIANIREQLIYCATLLDGTQDSNDRIERKKKYINHTLYDLQCLANAVRAKNTITVDIQYDKLYDDILVRCTALICRLA